MKKFFEYITFLAFTALVLALTLTAIVALKGKSSAATSSLAQHAVTAIAIETLPAATPLPTITPVPVGAEVTWPPTPIRVESLPAPVQGRGHIVAHLACNGVPKPEQPVYLVWIEDESSYWVIVSTFTNEEGLVFFNDLPPLKFAVLGEPPKSMPGQAFTVKPDQVNDFGDVNLAPALCK